MRAADAKLSELPDRLEADVDRMVVRSAQRAALHEAILEAIAQIAHFVRQPWRIDDGSIRFDGRLMLAAAAALARYDRLTSARLHARLGFELDASLRLSEDVRARVQRARDTCLSDLARLTSVSRSRDLPPVRRALRMEAAEQTPEQSTKRQRHREMATIVRTNLERRVRAFRKELAGDGRALPGETMTAVYAIVAAAFSASGDTASVDTVRRAWLSAKASAASLGELQEAFEGLRAQVVAGRAVKTAPKAQAARSLAPKKTSSVKKSIDRVMSKKK